ncbi:GNAT family N-acetyltransferase [Culicoidibacter larvae]|uniref:GNAT family N-acetyltransferase n=1 Tax=Culicoidibacter larvae TaxID=2579976 RepID=A0A5R8QDE3_9FIRM|nr:GNAT family protein [Culicoidibacter larvae]TLG75285.1 GNAT family N-acetyltransferase [Culicoidibacter larvae]
MKIIGERVYLRRFTETDGPALYAYLSDERVVQFEPYKVFTEAEASKEASRRASDENFWAVCLCENDQLIGNLYFAKQMFDTWEVGYVFNPQYYGYGYATEAVRLIIEYAFEHWQARRVTAACDVKNKASWHLLERLNMRREGHMLAEAYFKKDSAGKPIWFDSYQYAILKTEWQQS